VAPPKKPPQRKNPWDTSKGKVVHPKAPAGGGGPGGFSPKKPLQHDPDPKKPLPHPDSPAGRYTSPIDQDRDRSVPPPPAFDVGAAMAAKAKELVGQRVIGDGECYAMVDLMLQEVHGKTASDFSKRIGPDDNYKWGTPIKQSEVRPGDVLQIRNSEVVLNIKISYQGKQVDRSKYPGKETNTTMERGHHTAVVIAINPDGSLQVAEQHVLDDSRKQLSATIRQNTFPLRDVSTTETRRFTSNNAEIVETTTRTWKVVKGTIWAYRPVEKE
jgi:hypothetical protein